MKGRLESTGKRSFVEDRRLDIWKHALPDAGIDAISPHSKLQTISVLVGNATTFNVHRACAKSLLIAAYM